MKLSSPSSKTATGPKSRVSKASANKQMFIQRGTGHAIGRSFFMRLRCCGHLNPTRDAGKNKSPRRHVPLRSFIPSVKASSYAMPYPASRRFNIRPCKNRTVTSRLIQFEPNGPNIVAECVALWLAVLSDFIVGPSVGCFRFEELRKTLCFIRI